MTYEIKKATFGELQIGAAFTSASGARWFKRSPSTAVGLRPSQGPKGRHWDYFKSDDPVNGEVKSQDNVELIFFNRDCPEGYKTEIIQCHPDSVARIVTWYGGYHGGDDVTLTIDGKEAELDLNLELVT